MISTPDLSDKFALEMRDRRWGRVRGEGYLVSCRGERYEVRVRRLGLGERRWGLGQSVNRR